MYIYVYIHTQNLNIYQGHSIIFSQNGFEDTNNFLCQNLIGLNFFLRSGGGGRLKPLNPAKCYDPVYIYVANVLHNFAFLPKISLLNSYESILPLQNLCRNIFDLHQSFVVLLSIHFLVYICYYLDQ